MTVRADERRRASNPPPQEFMQAMGTFVGEMFRSGVIGGFACG